MKAGVWTYYHSDMPFEEKVRAFLQAGVRYGELSDEDGFALLGRGRGAAVGKEVKRFLDDYGFSLPQGHLWLRVNLAAPDYRESVEKLKEWIDLFHALGIRAAILHPGRCEDGTPEEVALQRRVEALAALCSYAEGSGITICMENMAQHHTSAAKLLELVKAVGSPQLGICLDTGHLNIAGGDQYAFITEAGNRLKAIHIADNEGERDQHMMPYGRGTVNWDAVLRGLRDIGYDGFCSFEIPGESRSPFEIRQHKLIYLTKMMAFMGMEI